jgi:hypothetical protein
LLGLICFYYAFVGLGFFDLSYCWRMAVVPAAFRVVGLVLHLGSVPLASSCGGMAARGTTKSSASVALGLPVVRNGERVLRPPSEAP